MIATLIAKSTVSGPLDVHEEERSARRPHAPEQRLHLVELLFGLVDARVGHVDFFDTCGGQELERWYRQRRSGHPR